MDRPKNLSTRSCGPDAQTSDRAIILLFKPVVSSTTMFVHSAEAFAFQEKYFLQLQLVKVIIVIAHLDLKTTASEIF